MEHYCVFFYYFIVGERGGLPMDEIDTVVQVFRSDQLHDVARGPNGSGKGDFPLLSMG